MWPFKKFPQRILLTKDYRTAGKTTHLRHVQRLGCLYVVSQYGDFDGRDVLILEPNGVVRAGDENLSWEKVDDIPGLTDGAAPDPA